MSMLILYHLEAKQGLLGVNFFWPNLQKIGIKHHWMHSLGSILSWHLVSLDLNGVNRPLNFCGWDRVTLTTLVLRQHQQKQKVSTYEAWKRSFNRPHMSHYLLCDALESVQKRGDVSTVTHYLEIRELKPALTVGDSKENTRGRKMGEKERQKKTVGFGVGTMSQKNNKKHWVAESLPDARLIPSTQVWLPWTDLKDESHGCSF